jgi:glycosyltransferase involved in cell wall biosynthesis
MNINCPLVSVICTVKNGENTIAETLESVVNQTLKEWEMIVVDDGSQDTTPSILADYARKDARIKPVLTRGIGRGKALNLAVARTKAKLIANIDADDPCHPERLHIQYQTMCQHPEFTVLGAQVVIIYDNEAPKWPELPQDAVTLQPVIVTSLLPYRNPISHSSVIMHIDALQRVEKYDEQRQSMFDYDLWVRLAAAGEQLGNLPLVLNSKRLHMNQSFENKRRLKYLWVSAQVQVSAIQLMKPGYKAWLILFIRLFWGLLPSGLRSPFRKFYQNRTF